MTAKRRSVTMADVARHAGVSRTTVSFVLSDRPSANIPEETRARILDAVAALGYRPNAGARALAAQRTRLIGLITDVVTTPFGAGIIRGAQDRARLQGQSLLIASINGDPALDEQAVETMLEHRVEGLVCATGEHRSFNPPASLAGVPTVLVHCFDEDGRLPAIVPDEVGGGYVATRRLTERRPSPDRVHQPRSPDRRRRGPARGLPPCAARGRHRARRLAGAQRPRHRGRRL